VRGPLVHCSPGRSIGHCESSREENGNEEEVREPEEEGRKEGVKVKEIDDKDVNKESSSSS
jgi:hypothetical protein